MTNTKFNVVYREHQGNLITRGDVANACTAVAAFLSADILDEYRRGYIDALRRVGLVFGVEEVGPVPGMEGKVHK